MHFEFTSQRKTLSKQAAFSLLELLIVITILGIVATVAIPSMSSTSINQLELAAEEMAEAMSFARSEAKRTGLPHGFRQQSGAKRIRVFRPDTTVSPWALIYDIYHPISKKLYDIEFDAHPFARVDTISRTPTFFGTCNQTGNIYFDGNGVPRCTDPETVLLSKFAVTLTLGKHSRVVTLNGITGRVSVQ